MKNTNPEWYQLAFDTYKPLPEELEDRNRLILQGFKLPDADGSRSDERFNEAILNNTFNEQALLESLRDLYSNSSHKLVASNTDNVHFFKWEGHFSDWTFMGKGWYKLSLPWDMFIYPNERELFKRSQFYHRWIKLDELMNNWEVFKWTIMVFVNQRVASNYEIWIEEQEVTIRILADSRWVDSNLPVYIWKFDTNFQRRIKISYRELSQKYRWDLPFSAIGDPRIAGIGKVILTFNMELIGDEPVDRNIADTLGDNMEFIDIDPSSTVINVGKITPLNVNYMVAHQNYGFWLNIISPKFFHEYPVLLTTDVIYRPYLLGMSSLHVLRYSVPTKVRGDLKQVVRITDKQVPGKRARRDSSGKIVRYRINRLDEHGNPILDHNGNPVTIPVREMIDILRLRREIHLQYPNELSSPDSASKMYVDLNNRYADNYDGWMKVIRPIVLTDAFTSTVEPYDIIRTHMELFRIDLSNFSQTTDEFPVYIETENVKTPENWTKWMALLYTHGYDLYLNFCKYYDDRMCPRDRELEEAFKSYFTQIETMKGSGNPEDPDYAPWNNVPRVPSEWTEVVNLIVSGCSNMIKRFYIADIIQGIPRKHLWYTPNEFNGKQRFLRPVDQSSFLFLEYDQRNQVWRPSAKRVKRHFPDVYTIEPPEGETLKEDAVYKAFFFYSDTPNVTQLTAELTPSVPDYEEERLTYQRIRAEYKNIFMEKFYWMAVRSLYPGLLLSDARWEVIEYVMGNASYRRFNELFLDTVDPYFKMGLATYLKGPNTGFPFDEALDKLDEQMKLRWQKYARVTSFEHYLDKQWVPSYFDFLERILDDTDISGRVLRRPPVTFRFDRVRIHVEKTLSDIMLFTEAIIGRLDSILSSVDSVPGLNQAILRRFSVALKGIVNGLRSILSYIDSLDQSICSIEAVSKINDWLSSYPAVVSELRSRMNALHEHATHLRGADPDNDTISYLVSITGADADYLTTVDRSLVTLNLLSEYVSAVGAYIPDERKPDHRTYYLAENMSIVSPGYGYNAGDVVLAPNLGSAIVTKIGVSGDVRELYVLPWYRKTFRNPSDRVFQTVSVGEGFGLSVRPSSVVESDISGDNPIYRISSIRVYNAGSGYQSGDIISIKRDIITYTFAVRTVNEGRVISVIPVSEYALTENIRGHYTTESVLSKGNGLSIRIETERISPDDTIPVYDPNGMLTRDKQYADQDLVEFKFENIYDQDIQYEVFIGGRPVADFLQKKINIGESGMPSNLDAIYLPANLVEDLKKSEINVEAYNDLIYRIDNLTIREPGAGFHEDQEVYIGVNDICLRLKVTKLTDDPTKGIAELSVIPDGFIFKGRDPGATDCETVEDDLNNIDDEFHVGTYDRLPAEGEVKPIYIGYDEPTFTSHHQPTVVNGDPCHDDDRNATFMYPSVERTPNMYPPITPEAFDYIPRILLPEGGSVDFDLSGYLKPDPEPGNGRMGGGDPDYGWYQGKLINNSYAGVVDDMWYAIGNAVEVLDPTVPDALRQPPGQPTRAEYQLIKRERIHSGSNGSQKMNPRDRSGIISQIAPDLEVPTYADLPRFPRDWELGTVGKRVAVTNDETHGGHRWIYSIREIGVVGHFRYDYGMPADESWDRFDIDWMKDDFYAETPSVHQQYPDIPYPDMWTFWYYGVELPILRKQYPEDVDYRVKKKHQGTYIHNITLDDIAVFNATTNSWEDLHDSSRWEFTVRNGPEDGGYGFSLRFIGEGEYSYDMRLYLIKKPDNQKRAAELVKPAIIDTASSIVGGEEITPCRAAVNTGRTIRIRKIFSYVHSAAYVVLPSHMETYTPERDRIESVSCGTEIPVEVSPTKLAIDFKVPDYMHFRNQIHLQDIQVYNHGTGKFEDILRDWTVDFKVDGTTRDDPYIHAVTNPMAPISGEIRLRPNYGVFLPTLYEVTVDLRRRTFEFSDSHWTVSPSVIVNGARYPENRIYALVDGTRFPIVNPMSNEPMVRVNNTDSGCILTYNGILKPYEKLRFIVLPYPVRSVYRLRRIPRHGFIDLSGKLNKPLNRKYYEFWVNGKILEDEVTIVSPTKLFLHGLTSLRNFEIVEINRDPKEYFAESFKKEDGTYDFKTYLDGALEGERMGETAEDIYTLDEQRALVEPVWPQVLRDHPEYRNYPENCNMDWDIFMRIHPEDFPITDYIGEDPYKWIMVDVPKINGVQVNGSNMDFDDLNFQPITGEMINELQTEEWSNEISRDEYLKRAFEEINKK